MSDLFSSVPPLAPLVWAVAQVTAVTAFALLAERLARRSGPRAGGTAALAGLAAAGVLTLAVFSPWPRWDGPEPAAAEVAAGERGDGNVDISPTPVPRGEPGAGVSLATARAFAAALLDPPDMAPRAEAPPSLDLGGDPRRPVRWGLLFAAILVAAGLVRFAAGWLLVARLRRRATEVRDGAVLAEFAALAAAAGVRGRAELLETDALATAAAVGSRRPAVLLPAGWRAWAPADRAAVLAHELSHVAAGDFGRNLLAQSLLLAQFYHPLAHLLAGRVRADQELSADAAAADLCGGRRPYLKSLAAVALSADPGPRRRLPVPAAWPARAFLPTRRTLHERVEMLRRPPLPNSRRAKFAGPLATAGVFCVAALASGFRPAPAAEPGPDPAPDPAPAFAPDPDPRRATPQAAGADVKIPDLLAYVPADVEMVGTMDVKALMTNPNLAPLTGFFTADGGPEESFRDWFGVGFAEVERVAVYVTDFEAGPTAVFVLLRTVDPLPAPANDGETVMWPRLDARTIAASASVPSGEPATLAGSSPADFPLLTAAAETARGSGAAVQLNVAAIRSQVLKELDRQVRRGGPEAAMLVALLRPLLTNAESAGMAMTIDEGGSVKVAVLAESPSESAAATVAGTAEAALTQAKNALDAAPALAGDDPQARMAAGMAANMARGVLAKTSVSSEGTRTTLSTEMDNSAPLLASLLLPAVQQAREAARRSQSVNNLKQIGLAMHNYHSTYKYFPPAVVEQNGVKRSWRVELLPFLDQIELWEAYRKDEPWDSAANRKVLAQMPDVFKHPGDDRDGHFTSYVAVIGGEGAASSLWTPRAEGPAGPWPGTKLSEVRDGPANTLMVVEANSAIPWTKPEDVTLDLTKPVDARQFGGYTPGGFNVAMTDVSVTLVADVVDPELLRALFTRAGGEVVQADPTGSGRPMPLEAQTDEAMEVRERGSE